VTSSENLMAGMRERLGRGLRPPSRFDGWRARRRSGGDEVDIDDPVVAPQARSIINWTWLTNY
jgi:hypothetical protein